MSEAVAIDPKWRGFSLWQYLVCLRGITWREALRFLHQRERFVAAFSLTGNADDVRQRLAAYRAAGVTDVVVTFIGPDPVHDMAYLVRATRA